jgi:hypothetical protein
MNGTMKTVKHPALLVRRRLMARGGGGNPADGVLFALGNIAVQDTCC